MLLICAKVALALVSVTFAVRRCWPAIIAASGSDSTDIHITAILSPGLSHHVIPVIAGRSELFSTFGQLGVVKPDQLNPLWKEPPAA